MQIWKNAVQFNGAAHPVSAWAKEMSSVCTRNFPLILSDVDKSYFVSFEMREQMLNNLKRLTNGDRLLSLDHFRKVCVDSVIDDGETTAVVVDIMSLKLFVQVDTFVRRLLAQHTSVLEEKRKRKHGDVF